MNIPSIPPEAVPAVWALVGAIARLVKAGSDSKAREEALMQTAEDVKAELDRVRFPNG